MATTSNIVIFRRRPAKQGLHRPSMMIRAAREGQRGWKRDRDLTRLLHLDRCPLPGTALPRLRAEEEIQNDLRVAQMADYDVKRHVLLMIAILAEMRAATEQVPLALAQ
ncbi:DUF6477 family protein [Paracoccus sp. (in: a-proteobacteria)]|uniref:DUF6477 family protein n=1 Tax=Paracoccus sp. TaxID=267 RepID=UPI00396CC344